jgi:hypothetical protein
VHVLKEAAKTIRQTQTPDNSQAEDVKEKQIKGSKERKTISLNILNKDI